MRPQLVLAFLLSACSTHIELVGPYATALSAEDVGQIKRLAASTPHIGRTTIKLEAIGRDRVHVDERCCSESDSTGSTFYAMRRRGTWRTDENSPIEATAERTIITY